MCHAATVQSFGRTVPQLPRQRLLLCVGILVLTATAPGLTGGHTTIPVNDQCDLVPGWDPISRVSLLQVVSVTGRGCPIVRVSLR